MTAFVLYLDAENASKQRPMVKSRQGRSAAASTASLAEPPLSAMSPPSRAFADCNSKSNSYRPRGETKGGELGVRAKGIAVTP
mgnify:CR=1 FL=1